MNDENKAAPAVALPRLVRPAFPAPMPLYMAPIGLFDFEGTLCVKTEYSTARRPDAYIVESGEYFWGGTDDPHEAAMLMVMPLEVGPVNDKIQP